MTGELCVWFRSSTDDSLERVLPISCKLKECKGYNADCKYYYSFYELCADRNQYLKEQNEEKQ